MGTEYEAKRCVRRRRLCFRARLGFADRGEEGPGIPSLDIPAVLAALRAVVEGKSGLPVLRVYWYDALRLGRPSPEQTALAYSADINIRLGQVNSAGEQKGVDALIITDLIDLARNQAIADAVLVSGDEDVRVGVLLAQQFGVRVHLLGIHPARGSQSPSLIQEADTTVEWDDETVRTFLSYTPPVARPTTAAPPATPAPQVAAATTGAGLDSQIEPLVAALSPSDLAALKALFAGGSRNVPGEQDKHLLRIGRIYFGQQTLDATEKSALRATFMRLVSARD
jgi:uncharacterized LabA/DUF88 family protein